MNKPRFHKLTLSEVRQDTADAVVLTFAVPPDLQEAYRFTPGQYLTLRDTIDGRDVRRSYSICSPLGAPLSVGVKAIEGGIFSQHAQSLRAGDTLKVMTPEGRFTAQTLAGEDILLVAAGSGITPMMSIARSTLGQSSNSIVSLLYANRTTESVMFRKEIEALKDQYMTRFSLTHMMDEELQDVDLFNGRLDAEKLDTLATRGIIRPNAYSAIYICGPQPMIEAASAALESLGAENSRIKYELFTPPGGLPVASESRKLPSIDGAKIHVTVDGTTRSFALSEGQAMVQAAERAGVEFPYSCNNGMCATCRCKLVSGTADMVQNFSLEPWELDAGYVLACQLRAQSEEVVLDFDAV